MSIASVPCARRAMAVPSRSGRRLCELAGAPTEQKERLARTAEKEHLTLLRANKIAARFSLNSVLQSRSVDAPRETELEFGDGLELLELLLSEVDVEGANIVVEVLDSVRRMRSDSKQQRARCGALATALCGCQRDHEGR